MKIDRSTIDQETVFVKETTLQDAEYFNQGQARREPNHLKLTDKIAIPPGLSVHKESFDSTDGRLRSSIYRIRLGISTIKKQKDIKEWGNKAEGQKNGEKARHPGRKEEREKFKEPDVPDSTKENLRNEWNNIRI